MPSGRAKNLQRYCPVSTFFFSNLILGPSQQTSFSTYSRHLRHQQVIKPLFNINANLLSTINFHGCHCQPLSRFHQSPAPQSLQRISKGSRKPEILATFRHRHHHWRIISQFLRNSRSNCNSCTLPGFFWQSSQTGGQPRQEMRWHPGKKDKIWTLSPFLSNILSMNVRN